MRTVLVLTLCALACAAIRPVPDEHEQRLRLVDASGAIEIGNQRESQAILNAAGLVPGGSERGRVSVSAGTSAIVLSQSPLVDVAGPRGGRLSEHLSLRIADITDPAAPRLIYAGGIGALPPTALGAARDGALRTYEFTVAFADDGRGDVNAVMGSVTSVGFLWDAAADGASFSADSASSAARQTGGPSCSAQRGSARAICRARAALRSANARCARQPGAEQARCYARAATAYRRTLAVVRCRRFSGSQRERCQARARRIRSPAGRSVALAPKT